MDLEMLRNLKEASFRTGRCDMFITLSAKRESVREKNHGFYS
jgi:hypothetical protein